MACFKQLADDLNQVCQSPVRNSNPVHLTINTYHYRSINTSLKQEVPSIGATYQPLLVLTVTMTVRSCGLRLEPRSSRADTEMFCHFADIAFCNLQSDAQTAGKLAAPASFADFVGKP